MVSMHKYKIANDIMMKFINSMDNNKKLLVTYSLIQWEKNFVDEVDIHMVIDLPFVEVLHQWSIKSICRNVKR
jgi:hypothetical protein